MNGFKNVTDMLGRRVKVPQKPKRIISLVPSQTELLYSLGLNDEVAAQTIFCIHPQEMHFAKPKIGGTKKLQFDKINTINPDLIIANKEENNKHDIDALAEKYPVWVSDVRDLASALRMIFEIGALTNKTKEAAIIGNQIEASFKQLQHLKIPLKTVYLIWQNPYMAAGKDTFIDYLLNRIGFKNLANTINGRYPKITEDTLVKAEAILLSSEPFPFKEKHIEKLQHINPNAIIKLVDGELFSWYGSRLLQSVTYFNTLVNDIVKTHHTKTHK
jgi:ABC-type Fe3+-hydroxamate transport system substrate-binding protein